MTSQQAAAGWYPDPNGGPGQRYWDGQQWLPGGTSTPQQIPQQSGISSDQLRAAMAENRSVWVTNGLAAWSLAIAFIGLIGDLACGVGVFIASVGLVIAFLAFNKSKQTGQGRGLAMGGLIANGVVFAIGFIVMVVVFGLSSS